MSDLKLNGGYSATLSGNDDHDRETLRVFLGQIRDERERHNDIVQRLNEIYREDKQKQELARMAEDKDGASIQAQRYEAEQRAWRDFLQGLTE